MPIYWGEEMRKAYLAAIVAVIMVSSVFISLNAAASGSETGVFPDRVFKVSNAKPLASGGASYIASIHPTSSGDWWVELTVLGGSYVTVQVYEGKSIRTKPLSSTDLSKVGQESKKVFLTSDVLYTVAFTCYGKKATVSLQEHFDSLVPYAVRSHAPIVISYNSGFTAANGVVSGDGSQLSPYVISGWAIDASGGGYGIRVEWTDAFFEIRQCYIHSAVIPYDAVNFYRVTNGLIENCLLKDNNAGILVHLSSSVVIRTVEFVNNGGACQFLECTDSSFSSNLVQTDNRGLAISYSRGIVAEKNTFSNGGIDIFGFVLEDYTSNTITPDNTLWGKPIKFVKESSVVSVVGEDVSQVIVAGCTYVHVMNMVMSGVTPLTLAFVDYGTVEKCEFAGVSFEALRLFHCSNLLITENWFHDSPGGYEGLIVVDASPSIAILGNTIERTNTAAMLIEHDSVQTSVIRNKIAECSAGVVLFYTSDTLVKWNAISSCSGTGVDLTDVSGITVEANTIDGNYYGLAVMESSSNGIFYNNITNNVEQVSLYESGSNSWDDGLGCGNYWSDYTGVDADGDGIGDSPYVLDAMNVDHFPMMFPWSGTVPGGLAPHLPIKILSDYEFTAENGVVRGSGTAADPFIVEGWSVDATSALGAGIQISSTSAYFSIQNVDVHNGMGYVTNNGIQLYNNQHAVSITGSVSAANYGGIVVNGCPGVTVSGNTISGNSAYAISILNSPGVALLSNDIRPDFYGVSVSFSDDALISNNAVTGGYSCLAVSDSAGVVVSGNTLVGMGSAGGACVGLWDCPSATISGNSMTNGNWGIWFAGGDYPIITTNHVWGNSFGGIAVEASMDVFPRVPVQGALVSQNLVEANQNYGIYVTNARGGSEVASNVVRQNLGDGITLGECVGVLVRGNTVTGNGGCGVLVQFMSGSNNHIVGNLISLNGVGVELLYTVTPYVFGNAVIDNIVQAYQDSTTVGALWDNGPLEGGNYWSDYSGIDSNADGIGDTPYVIDGTHMDRYPLMSPPLT